MPVVVKAASSGILGLGLPLATRRTRRCQILGLGTVVALPLATRRTRRCQILGLAAIMALPSMRGRLAALGLPRQLRQFGGFLTWILGSTEPIVDLRKRPRIPRRDHRGPRDATSEAPATRPPRPRILVPQKDGGSMCVTIAHRSSPGNQLERRSLTGSTKTLRRSKKVRVTL